MAKKKVNRSMRDGPRAKALVRPWYTLNRAPEGAAPDFVPITPNPLEVGFWFPAVPLQRASLHR